MRSLLAGAYFLLHECEMWFVLMYYSVLRLLTTADGQTSLSAMYLHGCVVVDKTRRPDLISIYLMLIRSGRFGVFVKTS